MSAVVHPQPRSHRVGRRALRHLAASGLLITAVATMTACGDDSTAAPANPSAASTHYTLAQVKTHNSKSSCWAAIDGKVYNLTDWINQHPGGPDKILGICGTDATAAFTAQHAGEKEPRKHLDSFLIGTLS